MAACHCLDCSVDWGDGLKLSEWLSWGYELSCCSVISKLFGGGFSSISLICGYSWLFTFEFQAHWWQYCFSPKTMFFGLGSVQVPNHAALVWRGDCTFTTKARIAQAAGAVSLIIVNDKEGLWTETEHSIHSIHLLVKIVNCQAYNASWLVLGGGIYALEMA